MSAYIPVRDEKANQVAFEKVRADKEREVKAGHDGTWVAHPGLVPLAREVFSTMGGDNQMQRKREDVSVMPAELMEIPEGDVTESRSPDKHQRRNPVLGGVASREGQRSLGQPDGGCCHGRDLQSPALAVDKKRHQTPRKGGP